MVSFANQWRHCIESNNRPHELNSITGLLRVHFLWQGLQQWPMDVTYILAGIWNSGCWCICVRCSVSQQVLLTVLSWAFDLPHLDQRTVTTLAVIQHMITTLISHIWGTYCVVNMHICTQRYVKVKRDITHSHKVMWTQAYVQKLKNKCKVNMEYEVCVSE